jgi:tripeptide aminopeptidase
MVNEKRLTDGFINLLKIESPSKSERDIALFLKTKLKNLGATVFFDSANKKTGGNTGNLIAKVKGNKNLPPVMLNAHMDTVAPTAGLKVIQENGIIKTDGNTILGGDDKSGVAIILEILRVIEEDKIPHPPIDIVFTVSEEIGLLGSKNLDYSLISAKTGYCLDTEEGVVIGAPFHNKLFLRVYGKEAHAGAEPENGINAIEVASKGIARLNIGRIDEETTTNIGIIRGGTATNIVPGQVEIKGEVRSHNKEKLNRETKKIIDCFKETAKSMGKEIDGKICFPEVEENVKREYNAFRFDSNDLMVKDATLAGKRIGMDIKTSIGGGGSDANIFNERGIKTLLIGTGMSKVHTKQEYIHIRDLVDCTRLMVEIIRNAN